MKPELKQSIITLSKYCDKRWKKYEGRDFGGCTPEPCVKCEILGFCYGTIPQWSGDLEELDE